MTANRLRDKMDGLREAGKTALIVYLTHGDPSAEASVELCLAAVEAGADVVELGVPFSDPNADGPVIQAAMERALAAGGGLVAALRGVAAIRARGCDVPLVLFGYYNPIFVYGVDRFAAEASATGVDAVLTVDLPIDELAELAGPLAEHGVGVVPLVAPTSTGDRIARIGALAPPFIYYISMTGVTGSAFSGARGGEERVAEIRRLTSAPVAVGFGIKTAADAQEVATYADGVVVGSALVRRVTEAESTGDAVESIRELVSALRAGIDAADA